MSLAVWTLVIDLSIDLEVKIFSFAMDFVSPHWYMYMHTLGWFSDHVTLALALSVRLLKVMLDTEDNTMLRTVWFRDRLPLF